jgi:hypothetical protein
MKMTKLEIILSGCITALFILLVIVANVEEDDISQLKYDNAELKAQLDTSVDENMDVDVIISSLTIQPQ